MKKVAIVILIIFTVVCLASCQYAVQKIEQLANVAQQELSIPTPEKRETVLNAIEN